MTSPPRPARPRPTVRARLRWRLLASVSAVALFVSVGLHRKAEAQEPVLLPVVDPGRWQIAFEGRVTAYAGGDTLWHCACMPLTIGPDYGADIGVSITRQMANGWLASLGVRYGRSFDTEESDRYSSYPLFSGGRASHIEQHGIVDFAVGRDVGLGMFGNSGGTSTLTAGVRIAHFQADTDIAETLGIYYSGIPYTTSLPGKIKRSFTGAGPRIAWNGSVPLPQNAAFTFDWGVAGALLFGRQKSEFSITYPTYVTRYTRKKSVVVPNVEAFAALSWQLPDTSARFSAGYRVDAYFNVIDGGQEDPDSIDRIIHGPFARFTIELDGP
jgi:hypothetical protein